jgi:predicted Rossmann fold nucleotide-binding protein DprA/Smf involved in DNA uptake
MKTIIAGTRTFNDYELLKTKLTEFRLTHDITEVVSGGASGADRLGEKYSTEYNINLKIYPANWKKHGNAAGPIRNRQMAEYADQLIVFWDGSSKGTNNMIDIMVKQKKPVYMVLYNMVITGDNK